MEEKFDLNRLCELATSDPEDEITSRKVHYYIMRGLLPSPGRPGPGANYELRHLNRLRLISQLKLEGLHLSAIRKKLENLSDDQVAAALDETAPRRTASQSALSYVQQVLSRESACRNVSDHTDMFRGLRNVAETIRQPVGWNRSQWDRIVLTRDIELHVRRPLTKEDNKRLERLIDEAGKILKED